MDFTKLATDIAVFLTPFLPYLVLGGEAVAKEVGRKFGEATWERAKSLWHKIQSPSLSGVAEALAENPNDPDFQTALAKLLIKQLETFPHLAAELKSTMGEDEAIQTVLVAYESKVRDIHQRLGQHGEQKVTIQGSQARDITQEMQ